MEQQPQSPLSPQRPTTPRQQQQTSQWVSDVSSIADSITGVFDTIFGNRPRPEIGPDTTLRCPDGQELVAGVCQCPSGQEYKNGRCQKAGGTSTLLWIGIGVAAIAGTYFLVSKLKTK